jgi:thymidylate synthase (FAD)
MKIIQPSYHIETPIHGEHGQDMLRRIELAARTCYKSECKITETSAPEFVKRLIQVKKHESVIEHASITVRFIADRGFLAEITRHRLASYSVESTRYCSYNKDQFGNEITVIEPPFWEHTDARYCAWYRACLYSEETYMSLLELGASPQEARSVLPNSLKTEIVMTANLREWRTVLKLRTSPAAHPQMREIMCPLLEEFKTQLEPIFGDV